MPLISEPVFFDTLIPRSGGKRRLFHVRNASDEAVKLTVREVVCPEWVEIEGVAPGTLLELPARGRASWITNVNTDHRFFPKDGQVSEVLKVVFDLEIELTVTLTIRQIQSDREIFRGIVGIDFGTSNSCFAWKTRFDPADPEAAFRPARASKEIPSTIYFQDVGSAVNPKFKIGYEAIHEIREHASQTYAYFLSIKRLLGSGRRFIVLDPRSSGADVHHRQEWQVDDICAFVLRDILHRIESEVKGPVREIVATFPSAFSRRRKEALRRAFDKAFRMLRVPPGEERVVLEIDEATAGAFNYIYGPLLDDFRRFDLTQRSVNLLTLDFGGGTTDVSLLRVDVDRKNPPAIQIGAELKGLTGEPFFGGDNVTLEVFRILKLRLAGLLAADRLRMLEAKEKSSTTVEDAWGTPSPTSESSGGGSEGGADWLQSLGTPAEDVAEKTDTEPEAVDEELQDIDPASEELLDGASRDLKPFLTALDRYAAQGGDLSRWIRQQCEEDGRPFDGNLVEIVENGVESLVPTRWAHLADRDPRQELIARNLFSELWQEADALKIRLSASKSGEEKPASALTRLARYAGVDATRFNEDVTLRLEELSQRVTPAVERVLRRAKNLLMRAVAPEGGVVRAGSEEAVELKVLLAGNAAQLPIIRRKTQEVLEVGEDSLEFRKDRLKVSVAQGACEWQFLRKEFGSKGLIRLQSSSFLDFLPYSIGLYNPELKIIGFEDGFCPIFPRGSSPGMEITLDSETNFLLHEDMTDLAIYGDYRDGETPSYVGRFDFRQPVSKVVPDAAQQAPAEAGKDDGEGSKDRAEGSEGKKPEGAAEPAKSAPAPQEGSAGEGGEGGAAPDEAAAPFRLRFRLLEDRELTVVNPATGEVFAFVQASAEVRPEDDPFSGVH